MSYAAWLATSGIALLTIGFILGWVDATIHYERKGRH